MAFLTQTPRLFDRQNIEALNKNQFGVYGLFRPGQWLYVGKGDIRERLLSHLNGDNFYITSSKPTHWVAELWSYPQMSSREKALIIELNPFCNQKIG